MFPDVHFYFIALTPNLLLKNEISGTIGQKNSCSLGTWHEVWWERPVADDLPWLQVQIGADLGDLLWPHLS